ncbi:MAG: methyltransferase domain-containing protein [Lentimicrobium sp.]|jgi:demethylmenaquinone methyltransferase/2-methoxy-6-polyprenyl-1,4-benzoquinol methylase|nr:methyltransferase domain-containing protein [Lentimicrobium sp.]
MKNKLYPESGVELTPFIAKHYDGVMNIGSFGMYHNFITRAINEMGIKPTDSILDLGCGTGRNAALMRQSLGGEGKITGVDLSPDMKKQFESRFAGDKRILFLQQRIDIPLNLKDTFDIVFISFVIHGFPHEVRKAIIENAKKHLKPGGRFIILDFAEFDMNKMPAWHRWVFKKIECPYAFDFIEKDWKQILHELGFDTESERLYFKKYVRLLTALKS